MDILASFTLVFVTLIIFYLLTSEGEEGKKTPLKCTTKVNLTFIDIELCCELYPLQFKEWTQWPSDEPYLKKGTLRTGNLNQAQPGYQIRERKKE